MKKVLRNGMVVVMAALFMSVFGISTGKAQGSVSLQVFYDELQPHGTWMQHGSYGYVWIPRVDRGFMPYASNGYWINTEYGNTWVSDYSWGWAPFHYGRWFHDDFYGWIWVPDTEWAPAWVAWRSGGGYYGWAPLMPGFGINVSFSYYNGLPNRYWNFVPYRYITYRTVYRHCVPSPHVVNIINNTTIITHNYTDNRRRTYFTGPTRNEMERTGRTRVDVYRISDSSRPGRAEIDRGTVSFYKPEVNNSRETRASAVPSRYLKADQNGNREMVESPRRERTSGYKSGNTLPAEKETSLRRSVLENNASDDRQNRDQRLPDRQSNPRSADRTDQNLRQQPDNNVKRIPEQQSQKLEQIQRQSSPSPRSTERQPQRTPKVERQAPARTQNGARQSGQPNQNLQLQRQNASPDIKRNPAQQRQPQIQRSSAPQKSNPPVRTGGSESSRRRN